MNLPHADIQTLLLATFALCLTLGASIWLAGRDTRSTELRGWALAMAVHACSYPLFLQRGHWSDWLSIVLANLLYSASFVLMLRAIGRFQARRAPGWLTWGPPPAVALLCVLFMADHPTRIVALNAIYLVQQLGLLRLARAGAPGGRGRQLLVAGLLVAAAIFAARTIAAGAGLASIPSLMAQSPLQTLSFLLGLVALLLASLGFLFMTLERAEREMLHKEEERKHSVRLLQRFIDHLPGTAYVKDAETRVLMANRGFRPLLGLEPANMIGKTNRELFPGPFGEKITADDLAVLASGQSVTIEESFQGRDYESTKFVIDEASDARLLAGITLDITARKQAERAMAEQMRQLRDLNRKLEEAHSQLLQSEKMAAIGQLAAGVAHELNNPIGFVHSNLGTLKTYLDDIFLIAAACESAAAEAANPADFARIQAIKTEKDYDYLKTDIFQLLAESTEGLQRVKKIVQDLKDFSRPGECDWQWADLHQGLDSTLNIVWNELKYKCTVKKDYGELPRVRCLPAQLNQVFMNLLVNAAHAIPQQGDIVIATRAPDATSVRISISDTGTGIAPEHISRLFDPFFTTKPVGKGTGLGLYIAYGIVQKHRGQIAVDSAPGRGTTFAITLPVDPAPAAEAAP